MLLQLLADGILTGAIIALGAAGVTLGLGVLRFANFAHAEICAVGAYGTLALLLLFGSGGDPIGPFSFSWTFPAALAAGVALAAVTALVVERSTFRPLARSGADPLVLVFASFGVALILRSLLHLVFGPDAFFYSRELQLAIRLPGEILIMPDQVLVLGVALLTGASLFLLLYRTSTGLKIRMVAENPLLTGVCGVDVRRVVQLVWLLVSGLAGLAGILYGLTVQLRPEMGLTLLLPLFTAAILGGVGRVGGAIVGGMVIGVAESLSTLVLPTTYRTAVPFVILLLVLALRPDGLFGRRA